MLILPGKSASWGDVTFTDDFNRADELLDASANWTKMLTTAQRARVVSNQLEFSTTTNSAPIAFYEADRVLPPNQYAQIEFRSQTTSITYLSEGVCVRLTQGASTGSGYWARMENSSAVFSIELLEGTNGTYNSLGKVGWTPSAGQILRLEASGSSITVKLDGSTIIGPITDSTHATGKAGVASFLSLTTSSAVFDNFECGSL